jgi:adenylate cyclase
LIFSSFSIKNPLFRPLLIGWLVTLVLIILGLAAPGQVGITSRNLSLDILTRLFPYEKSYSDNSQNLVFINIDDESLKQVGQWPWPRQTIAKLLNNVDKSGVASTGIDILFLEQDRFSPAHLSKVLNISESQLTQSGAIAGDVVLGSVLEKSRAVLGFSLGRKNNANVSTIIPGHLAVIGNALDDVINAPKILKPIPQLAKAIGYGFVDTDIENGLIRETPLLAQYSGTGYPSLSLDMLRIALNASNHVVKESDSGHALLIKTGNVVSEVNPQGRMILHHGHYSRFKQIPAYQLLSSPIKELNGKIVVIGSGALALGDIKSTSLEEAVPGSLFHLQIIDQILANRFITTHPTLDALVTLICGIIALGICVLIVRIPLIYSLIAIPLTSALVFASAIYAFLYEGFLPNFPIPIALLLLSGIATYSAKSLQEASLKKKFQSSFAQYVPKDVVNRISRNNVLPRLGGEITDATVLFLDIRGFTTLSESLKDMPELLVSAIGTIMNEVTERLVESGATIDKYIGDAVMAFWNAPEKQPDHAARALFAACTITRDAHLIANKVKALDPRLQDIDVNFGIGIASGEVTVGNMGSTFRFNYTVLGDTVNTASRLEHLTKDLDAPILMSGSAYENLTSLEVLGKTISIRPLGNTEIRGKSENLAIYTAAFK